MLGCEFNIIPRRVTISVLLIAIGGIFLVARFEFQHMRTITINASQQSPVFKSIPELENLHGSEALTRGESINLSCAVKDDLVIPKADPIDPELGAIERKLIKIEQIIDMINQELG